MLGTGTPTAAGHGCIKSSRRKPTGIVLKAAALLRVCTEECGTGGVSERKDSNGDNLSLEESEHQVGGMEFSTHLGSRIVRA